MALVVEAAVALLITQAALRTLSLRTVVDLSGILREAATHNGACRAPSVSRDFQQRLAWAIDAASARAGGACLVRSVALQALLGRRGVTSDLCVAFRNQGGPIPGHAWIEVEGTPLGADGRAASPGHASGFEVLSRFSSGSA